MFETESLLEHILKKQKEIGKQLFPLKKQIITQKPATIFSKSITKTKSKMLFRRDKFYFTLWDVGHGLSIWIKEPKGHNLWIDLGGTKDFSPSEHVRDLYNVKKINYLILSHLHQDHLSDLQNFLRFFPGELSFIYNQTIPLRIRRQELNDGLFVNMIKLINRNSIKEKRIKHFKKIGKLNLYTCCNPYKRNLTTGNNTSVFTMLLYSGMLIVCPGDIENVGWILLWNKHKKLFEWFMNKAKRKILIAPHHGSKETYSADMMKKINPHLTIISDAWGASETHNDYYMKPIGMISNRGERERYFSTKKGGRIQLTINEQGEYTFSQDNVFQSRISLR